MTKRFVSVCCIFWWLFHHYCSNCTFSIDSLLYHVSCLTLLAQAVFDNWYLKSVTDCDPTLHSCAQKNIIGVLTLLCTNSAIHHTAYWYFGKEVRQRLHGCLSEGTRGHTNTQLVITRHIGSHWQYPLWDIWGLTILVALVQQGKEWVHNSWGESTSYLGVWYYWVSKNHNLVPISRGTRILRW